MSEPSQLSRRRFLRRTAALAAGGAAAPCFIPSGVLASSERPGANDRIGVAYIGVGRRGNQLMGLPPEGQIVAAADVDISRAQAVAARRNCRAYQDYRKMLESGGIDAVVVA